MNGDLHDEERDMWGEPPDHDDPEEALAPYVRGSKTSEDAARRIDGSVDAIRAMVLEFMRKAGEDGVTDQEAQVALSLTGNTQRPRRRELEDAGFVVDSGRTRKTLSNRSAVAWKVTEMGMTMPCPSAAHKPSTATKKLKDGLRGCLSILALIVNQADRSITSIDFNEVKSAYDDGFRALYGTPSIFTPP